MASILSWDSFMNMQGNLEAELECISSSSASSDMKPPTVRRKNKSPEIDITEIKVLTSPPPIYGDTTCVFSREESMSWYQVYQEFTQPEFPEDLPDREVYMQVKRSKIHYVGAHPSIFPCAKIIDWIIQNIDPKRWVIRDHEGKDFANIKW